MLTLFRDQGFHHGIICLWNEIGVDTRFPAWNELFERFIVGIGRGFGVGRPVDCEIGGCGPGQLISDLVLPSLKARLLLIKVRIVPEK